MTSVDHALITRFNLPTPGVERTIRMQSGWLEGRVRLFERYCAPSVRAQRDGAARWLIYFDPGSPPWLKDWIDQTADGLFHPVFREAVATEDLLEDLDALFPSKSEVLLTSNLDNDDGLGLDFVAALRNHDTPLERAAIYLARGLIKSPSGLYLRNDPSNAFVSVRESWEQPFTSWGDWHNRLHLTMPVEVISGPPRWLQVVHQTNVSNRTRGRLVSPEPYRKDFVGLNDIAPPHRRALAVDRLALAPLRTARDSSRAAIRDATISLIGRDGFSRLKAALRPSPK